MKAKELVLPGTFLGTAEEYVPGRNAYEDADGSVRSETIGIAQLDEANHEVNVQTLSHEVKPIERGCIVKAVVTNVKDKVVMVEMFEAAKDGEPRKILNSFATIPVFQVSNRFVERLSDLFKIGDILETRVAEVMAYGIDLTTKDPELGVIKGYCTKCRGSLQLFGETLKCVACGNPETRKISSNYTVK